MPNRSFTDPDGVLWQAWDVIPGQYYADDARRHLPPEMADGWLCFESAREKRRLTRIPPEWHEWSDEQLWTLCRDAEPVKRRPLRR